MEGGGPGEVGLEVWAQMLRVAEAAELPSKALRHHLQGTLAPWELSTGLGMLPAQSALRRAMARQAAGMQLAAGWAGGGS